VIGPIPLTAIWAYVDRYDLPGWAVDALLDIDRMWFETERQGAASPDAQAQQGQQPPPRPAGRAQRPVAPNPTTAQSRAPSGAPAPAVNGA
jgi:hypothetical protein